MSQSLQTILNDFIKEQDKSVVKKKRTFESYITDLLKDYSAERTISVYLSQIDALSKIASPNTKNLGEGEIVRYADELVQRFAVDKTKAKEMVRMWAIALGVQVPNQSSQLESEDEETQKNDIEENQFFESVKKKNTIDSYSEYIDKYPNGKYVHEAARRIYKISDQFETNQDIINLFIIIVFQIIVFFIAAHYGVHMSIDIIVGFGIFIPLFLLLSIKSALLMFFKNPTYEVIKFPKDNNYQQYSIYKNMVVREIGDKKDDSMACILISDIIKQRKQMVYLYHIASRRIVNWSLIALLCILLLILDYISFIK